MVLINAGDRRVVSRSCKLSAVFIKNLSSPSSLTLIRYQVRPSISRLDRISAFQAVLHDKDGALTPRKSSMLPNDFRFGGVLRWRKVETSMGPSAEDADEAVVVLLLADETLACPPVAATSSTSLLIVTLLLGSGFVLGLGTKYDDVNAPKGTTDGGSSVVATGTADDLEDASDIFLGESTGPGFSISSSKSAGQSSALTGAGEGMTGTSKLMRLNSA
mmetsp:Transcript_73502/g.116427  ORF Transcript_73502/g.116427 Transcript_73502/m.116427 type:complete len:218 (+) Transcript_73502:132-785(+)